MIPFNKPFLTGKETDYICQAVQSGKLSGNGEFTRKCQRFFQTHYGFHKALMTTSCTDALEMAAILSEVGPGDEIIVPSYTFVSTVLAFVRQGAVPVFCDSCEDNPDMDPSMVERLVTSRTKAIVPVHYAGIACDMDRIAGIAASRGITVVEDAAQAVDSYYKGKPLGSIGEMGCFSFHETKNIISGEGGLLTINSPAFDRRSEIIWEKGTNRSEFFRGEVNKYGWVDTGSSFLPSEIVSAFLYAQLENLDVIQTRRKELWLRYHEAFRHLEDAGKLRRPVIPEYATNNAHMYFVVCRSLEERSALIAYLKERGILAVFHYLSLHKSEFYTSRFSSRPELPNCDRFADCLLRLPLYFELSDDRQDRVIEAVDGFYKDR